MPLISIHPHAVVRVVTPSSCSCMKLTSIARTPGLISIIAGDSQYSLLYGRAVDVLNWAGGLEILFDGLVHHQVLELSELRADVRKPSGAHVGRLAHPAGKREQVVRALGKEKGKPVKLVNGWMRQESFWAKPEKSVLHVPQRGALRAPVAPLVLYRNHHPPLALHPAQQHCKRH